MGITVVSSVDWLRVVVALSEVIVVLLLVVVVNGGVVDWGVMGSLVVILRLVLIRIIVVV